MCASRVTILFVEVNPTIHISSKHMGPTLVAGQDEVPHVAIGGCLPVPLGAPRSCDR